jgi:hypothetical protein
MVCESLERAKKDRDMIATCKHCDSTFRNVDRNDDGSPYIEATRCAHPGCDVDLCQAGCEHLSFICDACGRRFCSDHKVALDGLQYCHGCAVEAVESQEPECECHQTDADLFDAAGCELHDPVSPWERASAGGDRSSGVRGGAPRHSLKRRML